MVNDEQVEQDDPWARRVAGLRSHGPCTEMPHFKAAALPNPLRKLLHPTTNPALWLVSSFFLHVTNEQLDRSYQYTIHKTYRSITLLFLFAIICYRESNQAVGWLPTGLKKPTKAMSRRPHRSQNNYSLLIRRETGKVCKKVLAQGCRLQYIRSGQTQNEACCWKRKKLC